jgi:hypothetical protein
MLRIIFWVIVAVLFLSFFGVSVQSLFENPTTQTNFDFVIGLVEEGWESIWTVISGLVMGITETVTDILPS